VYKADDELLRKRKKKKKLDDRSNRIRQGRKTKQARKQADKKG
jgi:hypothetical protein